MKKLFLLLVIIATMAVSAMAQTITVSGTVTYAGDGEPLPGVSIVPIGGGNGTVTDVDGKFSLKVPERVSKIRVSYVGMVTQEVPVGQNLNIALTNTENKLDEVMVVAYGKAKKAAFTGSAVSIDGAAIEDAPVTNVLSVLNGKMPGANLYSQTGAPGAGPTSIVIRGFSSLNASMQPLIVLDGVPFAGSVGDINTNDVESLTVLKDAASTALYGARGANGVIIITTKKAKNTSTGQVTFNANWGANTRATQDYNTIKDPKLYYETYYKSLYNYYTANGYTPDAAWRNANNNLINNSSMGLKYQIYQIPEGEMFIGSNGKLNPNATLGNYATYNGEKYYITPDNWLDETYSASLRQEYNLTVSNSSDRSNFYASVGYLDNEGIIKNTEYRRFTGRLSADSQIKSWLKAGATASYAHYTSRGMSGDGSGTAVSNPLAVATTIGPIFPMYVRDANGNIMHNADGMTIYDFGNASSAPGIGRPMGAASGMNGMSDVLYNTNVTRGNTLNANGFLEIRFLNDFKFTTNNTVFLDEYRGNFVGNPYFGSYQSTNGLVSVSHDRMTEYTFQQLLEWNRIFGKHDISVLLGHENSYRKTATIGASRTQLFSPSNPELAGAVVDGSMESYTGAYNNEGYIIRALYDYDSKYFANAYFRRDASSRFHPSHRWGSFWALGAAWIISKEDFFNVDWVNVLKFKASYGQVGNDGIGAYRYTNTYTIANVGGKPSLVASSVKGNPDITWEKTGSFNAGFEFDLFNNRLSGTIEGYYAKTSDMLYQRPLPASTGFSNIYENFGDVCNYGVDIDLNGTVIATRDFSWDLNLNMSHLKNKVLKLPDINKTSVVDGHGGSASGGFFMGEGLPVYSYYEAVYAGVNETTGEPMFWGKDKDGSWIQKRSNEITQSDYQLTGCAIPKLSGGFGTSLRYKGIEVSAQFTYQIGGKVKDGNYSGYMTTMQSGTVGGAIHADWLDAWTPENPHSNVPRWQYGDDFSVSSNRFLTDASYLNFQNLRVAYTLPSAITRKFQVSKLNVYVSCENLWLWSKRQGFDPRTYALGVSTSSSLSGGNTYNAAVRTITGGVTLSF